MTLSAPTIDFNPRPPWGGRQEQRDNYKAQADISIHALRGEGDSGLRSMTRGRMISIHALRGEGDVSESYVDGYPKISIHALRGEGDLYNSWNGRRAHYFNPRPPWGGRLRAQAFDSVRPIISIHALRGEGDSAAVRAYLTLAVISVHALRGEGDGKCYLPS